MDGSGDGRNVGAGATGAGVIGATGAGVIGATGAGVIGAFVGRALVGACTAIGLRDGRNDGTSDDTEGT